ncbi:MAG: thioredoxin fold domain-containing protein [Deltaproteobacteria bacterium]|nr:thioredoxin fold domain-containing protein [Deltaproteobacteria bacterium]
MVTMIDFGADTCIPCKMMKPILEELHMEYKGKAAIVYVDIRGRSDIPQKYRLRGIPTQVFYDTSGKEVYRHVGFMDKASVEKQLQDMGVRK